ncbi:MAG: multidrug efflux SMR transporter [Magnetospirillum gryphiswaldense]|uniref:DMT family transporter n=1 Tax=Magnetospirillum sp. 64-120 TaxID=1895778 RepID=UPI0009267A3E|nr:multidrug efflux SMR transporter [Magnetospirillum sp. 64-120]MBI2241689.1 multidrug efflux SMR transporter [Magnetospirillum gryphiswaldense]OJX81797.1 MAG: QacE family quaternary ammonium compound efflux SMR transporter [Magnetospirillum sp. 64-120]
MAWVALFFAGLLEVAWALGLKASEGFTKPVISIMTGAAIIASLGLLGVAVRTLPVGTAYAVWSGIGILGTTVIGVLFLGESANMARLACIALVAAGIVGLKLTH